MLRRSISDDEEQLLDELWQELDQNAVEADSDQLSYDYMELQQRLAVVARARRRRLALWAGGVAASLIVGAVLLFTQPVDTTSNLTAELQRIEAAVEFDQVRLTSDDGLALTLDQQAVIAREDEASVALTTAMGDQRLIASDRLLTIEVPNGRQFQLTLSDGTSVWLNSGSRLQYPATFEGHGDRRVRLRVSKAKREKFTSKCQQA